MHSLLAPVEDSHACCQQQLRDCRPCSAFQAVAQASTKHVSFMLSQVLHLAATGHSVFGILPEDRRDAHIRVSLLIIIDHSDPMLVGSSTCKG